MRVLAPGQNAGANDLGDSTCFAGEASFRIDLYGSQPQAPFAAGPSGRVLIDGLPPTSGGTHTVTEIDSGASGRFAIQTGEVTRVIFLNYEEDILIEDELPTATPDGGDPVDEGMDPGGVVGEAAYDGGSGTGTDDGTGKNAGGNSGIESVTEGRDMTTTGSGPSADGDGRRELALVVGAAMMALTGFGVRRRARRAS